MKDYFLSYSRADNRVALKFADDLIAAGISLWVDQYDIRASQHWDRAIETAVDACRGLIVLLSPSSAASPNVADEVSAAIDRGKTILPVMIERCTLPLRMTRMQYVDATGDSAQALRRCLAELGRAGAPLDTTQAAARASLAPELREAARLRLVSIMGPIASRLVARAADRASGATEFYNLLAADIPDATDRARFLADLDTRTAPPVALNNASPEISSQPVSIADTRPVVEALSQYLGPIAAHMVARELKAAASAEDLNMRLAALIPAPRDRAGFLKRVTAR